jgi:hypothetical protein
MVMMEVKEMTAVEMTETTMAEMTEYAHRWHGTMSEVSLNDAEPYWRGR